MILFPNAKINLGLRVLNRRPDGYHELMTVMMPVPWQDVLEIVPARAGAPVSLTVTGRTVDCPTEKNLVMKAYRALEAELGSLPPAEMYLQKNIPDGAGLGGGSADASFTLVGLNEVFGLGLTRGQLARVAAGVGADCPFFVYNETAYCTGTGTTISAGVHIDLSAYTIVVAKPQGETVSTAEAYAAIRPCGRAAAPVDVLGLDISLWPEMLVNDFEASVFPRHPRIASLKRHMTDCGARYAAMSGSGAAVFGIFDNDNLAQHAADTAADCDTFVTGGADW